MLLPTKHTSIEKSLLGFGGYLIKIIEDGATVDSLWQKYIKDYKDETYPAKHSFDNMLRTLLFLFSVGIIEEKEGVVKKCNY
jgi:hypothetical protein